MDPNGYRDALTRASSGAMTWLESIPTRDVAPRMNVDEMVKVFSKPLQSDPVDPVEVVEALARLAEPGLMAMASGRFFGWVIGGTLPASLGADWLVSAWDQNAAMRYASPATAAIEQVAGEWLLDALGLPAGSDVGFTTGATMANWTGLAAARAYLLDQLGWDVNTDGLRGSPQITVCVGAERHTSVDLALRYLGLGSPTVIPADAEGRILVDDLGRILDRTDGAVIVCLQAGNLHSGAFDPMAESVAIAHAHGAWVHVDGAFGLWASASPTHRGLVQGVELADSWATDAHKTLNVPYDCGVAVIARAGATRAALGTQTAYLVRASGDAPDPYDVVPEMSRRARGVPVWAALRQLGRAGLVSLIDGLVDNAKSLAAQLGALDGIEVLNEVTFTQVCLSFGSDVRTREVTRALIDEGAVWMSGSRWHDRDVLRISVSNWSTDAADIDASVAAIRRAMALVGTTRP